MNNDPWGKPKEDWGEKPEKPKGNPYQSPYNPEAAYSGARPQYEYQTPNRGGTVLGLGLGSFAGFLCAFACCLPITFLTAPIGFAAWFMGRADLHKIKCGRMDSRATDQLMIGSIVGLIFAVLSSLLCLVQLAFLGFLIYVGITTNPP